MANPEEFVGSKHCALRGGDPHCFHWGVPHGYGRNGAEAQAHCCWCGYIALFTPAFTPLDHGPLYVKPGEPVPAGTRRTA